MAPSMIFENKIFYFAIMSRLSLILIQIISNAVIPDHNAVVFNPEHQSHTSSPATVVDCLITFLLGGFKRWDAVYFTHIAEHGYTFENTLAFFPLFPLVVRSAANTFLFPLQFIMSYASVILLSATVVNFVAFVKSVQSLYRLGKIVTGNDTIAYTAALLYCVNPASVFLSAPYSECIYAYLTFTGLLKLEERKTFSASILIAFSCLTRSNGLLNLGYLAYLFFKESLVDFKRFSKAFMMDMTIILTIPWIFFTRTFLPYCIKLTIGILPFVAYQYYCYQLYCEKTYQLDIPEHLIQYARDEGLKLPADESSSWCFSTVPLAYRYIQTYYWDQGLFKYWQIKQIPNFLLATPVTVLVFGMATNYLKHNRYLCVTLGLDEVGAAKKEVERSDWFQLEGVRLLPYVLHTVVLTVFGLLCIHVQVLTRLLFSSTPVIYWYTAYWLLGELPRQQKSNPYDIWRSSQAQVEKPENLNQPWKNLLTNFITNFKCESLTRKLILAYFIGYYVIGVVMFSNFLPWT